MKSKSILVRWITIIMMITEYASLINQVNGFIGMNWGRMASQRIVPSIVVDMLLQNGIEEVKIYSTSDNVLESFTGTNITLTVTLANEWFKVLLNVEDCVGWLHRYVIDNVRNGGNIRYVTIGANPYSGIYFNQTFYNAIDVLKNMVVALNRTDFGPGRVVKPTMNHFVGILDNTLKPSESDFNPDIKELVVETMRVLRDADAPVTLDIFPMYNAINFTNDMEFDYFYNNSTAKFMDGEYTYRNIFEVMYDKLLCALDKNGLTGLKVFGGSLGWPTDGIKGGSVENAQRFHNGLLKYFKSGRGTPRHPGPIDVYMHNFADENTLKYLPHTEYSRHWGIYWYDGKPKYHLDYTGQGKDIEPVKAKGVTYMPKRWCVINKDSPQSNNLTLVKEQTRKACNETDCTNSACAVLDDYTFASYAFNMHFQTKSQKISLESCTFEGLGMIVPDDPSTGNCIFPVGILPAEDQIRNGACKRMSFTTLIIILWSIFVLAC